MDSLITAAARALSVGDPLGALKRVALRDDAAALALRGIAMAQLGDLARAKALLKSAARGFGAARGRGARQLHRRPSRDRTGVARAGLAGEGLGLRPGRRSKRTAKRSMPRMRGYLEARQLLLIGRLAEAERKLAELDPAPLPPASRSRA